MKILKLKAGEFHHHFIVGLDLVQLPNERLANVPAYPESGRAYRPCVQHGRSSRFPISKGLLGTGLVSRVPGEYLMH
jgi:hypothetical protein